MSSPDIVDISAQPAIATWAADNQACRRLDALKFHIFHDPSTNAAFFKLRAPITFQTTTTKSKKTTAVWLFIPPERIATLALQGEDGIDEATRKQLGPNVACLCFNLTRPAILVLPPDIDQNPKEKIGIETLGALQSLARATRFAISASLPGRTISQAQLLSLCTAASSSKGSSCADSPQTRGTLVSSKHAADTVSLYGGKGGTVIEGESPAIVAMTGDGVSPPPYADIGASPSSVPASWVDKKRRRRASSDAGPDYGRQHFAKSMELKMALEDFKSGLRSELKQDLKSELVIELQAELKHELRAKLKDELKAELKNELVSEVMQEVETRIFERVEQRLQEQADDFDTQLYDVRHEFGGTIYSEVEDQTYAVRQELEDFVKDEMNEAQAQVEDLRRRLVKPTSAPVDPDLVNEWAGASTADVEAFCLALDASGIKGFSTHLFVALDADGVGDKTCVLAQRVIDWDADPIRYPEQFDKARVPWYQTHSGWANLDIANLGWDEMMLEDADEGNEGGWWTYDSTDHGVYLSDEKRRLRDEAISRLGGEGKA